MKLQLHYDLDKGLLVEGMRSVMRRRYLLVRVYSGLLFLAGLATLFSGPRAYALLGWVLLAGGPLTWLMLELQVRRFAGKQMRLLKGGVRTTLDDESIRQELASMKSEIKWSAVLAARRTERLWLLMISPVQAIHLPCAAFSPEAAQAFEAFLRQRGLLAP